MDKWIGIYLLCFFGLLHDLPISSSFPTVTKNDEGLEQPTTVLQPWSESSVKNQDVQWSTDTYIDHSRMKRSDGFKKICCQYFCSIKPGGNGLWHRKPRVRRIWLSCYIRVCQGLDPFSLANVCTQAPRR